MAEWDLETTVAVVALILTGIGIIIALMFNYFATQQNSRNQQYQMKKDFFEKYHEIIGIGYDKPAEYMTKLTNFVIMIFDLYNDKIIKKETLTSDMSMLVKEALWIYTKSGVKDSDPPKGFIEFCDKNNLKPLDLSINRSKNSTFKNIVQHHIDSEDSSTE